MSTVESKLKLTLLDQISGRARAITGVLDRLHGVQNRFLAPLGGTFGQLAAFAGAYLGVTKGIDSTVGAAISFESAFADVRKVVDATDEQLQNMERSIRKLSTVVPSTANDLAALFAAGAESGIAANELNQFAEMASRVGIAFDIPMATAGESLAKLKTQLGLTLAETGDLADAMNHLSNNMASKASDIQAFMLRVGALAEMGGLAKEEIAALGSAMIAAGAEPEVAATAMQNVVKAMTRGASAKKAQKDVAKALGLNLPQLARDMQKDAPKAIKKVLAAIAKQPKDRHISLLSDFFGDEAKAFAPLIGNIGLLDQALDSVADKTKYAGSAYREYIERSKTTANVLQILQNKFAELGRSIGDDMLPGLKEGALAIGHIIDTLGERATIFDQLQTAIKGFTNGLGLKGGIGEAIESLGDLLLGVDNGSEAADKLGRIFARFQSYGQQVKQFADDVDTGIRKFEKAFHLKDGTVGDTISSIAGWGFTLGAASIGISMAAGAVLALGRALMVLSGASLLIGGAKGLGALFGVLGGATAGGAIRAASAGSKAATAAAAASGGMSLGAKIFGALAVVEGLYSALQNTTQDGIDNKVSGAKSFADSITRLIFGDEIANRPDMPSNSKVGQPDWVKSWNAMVVGIGRATSLAVQDALRSVPRTPVGVVEQMAIQNSQFPGKTKDDYDIGRKTVSIDAASISALLQPAGVQQVHVVNQAVPNVTVSAPISITGIMDPRAAASSAASQLGEKVKSAVEATNTD